MPELHHLSNGLKKAAGLFLTFFMSPFFFFTMNSFLQTHEYTETRRKEWKNIPQTEKGGKINVDQTDGCLENEGSQLGVNSRGKGK